MKYVCTCRAVSTDLGPTNPWPTSCLLKTFTGWATKGSHIYISASLNSYTYPWLLESSKYYRLQPFILSAKDFFCSAVLKTRRSSIRYNNRQIATLLSALPMVNDTIHHWHAFHENTEIQAFQCTFILVEPSKIFLNYSVVVNSKKITVKILSNFE